MNRSIRKSVGWWTPLLAVAATVWIGCGGGDSEEERWGVDPVDSGTKSESDTAGGKDDKGSAGRKSTPAGGKGEAGGSAANGGKGGDKAGAGNGGSGGKSGAAGKGGAGGKAAAGGKGGAGKGGAGGGNSMSSDVAIKSAACLACEKLNPDGACKERRAVCPAFGATKAMGGPKAGGLKTDLCDELLECVGMTRCALMPGAPPPMGSDEIYPHRCLCGDEDVDACLTNAMPKGPCASQVIDSSESTMGPDIAQRLVDPSFAVGAVFATVTCDAIRCAKSCGLCDPKEPGCVDMDAANGGEAGADAGM